MPRPFLRPVFHALAAFVVIAGALWGCNTLPTSATNTTGTTGTTATTGTTGATGSTGTATTNAGFVTPLEQLSLERINRARLHPGAEAGQNNIAVDEGVNGQINALPKPALAMNAKLVSAARGHSQDMINRNYFAHNTPDGVTPVQRVTAAGYTFNTFGENLSWRGTTGALNESQTVESEHIDLFVDAGFAGRGHRVSILNPDFREVGIGIVRGPFTQNGTRFDSIFQTQDFGAAAGSGIFVIGVVYNDANSNGQYDFNEGVANTNVSLDGTTVATNLGGGYAFMVTTVGDHTLAFAASNATHPFILNAGSLNLKVDLVNGATLIVNLGLGPL